MTAPASNDQPVDKEFWRDESGFDSDLMQKTVAALNMKHAPLAIRVSREHYLWLARRVANAHDLLAVAKAIAQSLTTDDLALGLVLDLHAAIANAEKEAS